MYGYQFGEFVCGELSVDCKQSLLCLILQGNCSRTSVSKPRDWRDEGHGLCRLAPSVSRMVIFLSRADGLRKKILLLV